MGGNILKPQCLHSSYTDLRMSMKKNSGYIRLLIRVVWMVDMEHKAGVGEK